MTSKTWNGANGSFDDAAQWTPAGVPQPNDIATINSGTVSSAGDSLSGLMISINGAGVGAPTIDFTNTSLASVLVGDNTAAYINTAISLNVTGTFANNGFIVLNGSRYNMTFAAYGSNPALLVNNGSINLIGSSPQAFVADTSTPVGTIQNSSTIAFWNPNSSFQSPTIAQNITGQGVITIAPNARTDFAAAIGSGQNIRFEGGTSGGLEILQLDDFAAFQGSVTGFSSGDLISIINTPYDHATYTATGAGSGTLSIFSSPTTLAGSINFTGTYQLSDFSLTYMPFSGGGSNLKVSTTANPSQLFTYTDTTVSLSTSDAGTTYTGSASGLQNQYTSSTTDLMAIRANTENSYVVGGSNGDAIQVLGGANMIDGGSGSNFLIGGTGAGSQDSFYMNGQIGNNWDTIINFHSGDTATFYGFNAGTSTINWTATDGAAGYQGVTLHSELSGPATGFNGSFTFAGVSLATQQSSFAITGGTGFIQIHYN